MADVNRTVKIILKGESDKLNKSIGSANASFAKFAKGAAAAGAAIVAVGSAIFKMNQKVANMVNQLSDAQAKTGIQISTLQGLKRAAEGSGRAFESIEGGLIRFQSAINMASQGTGRQAEAFQKLGVQVTNADGSLRDANSVFNDSIKALADMGEGIDRNSTAMDLFGRTAGSALVQSGAISNMEKFIARTKEWGLDAGPAAREEAAKWQRAMAELNMVMRRAIQDIVSMLTGGGSLSSAVVDATSKFIFMKTVVANVMKGIVAMMKMVIGSITSVALSLGQVKFEKISSAVTTLGMGMAGVASGRVLDPRTWTNLASGFKQMNQVNKEVGAVAAKLSGAVNDETAAAIDNLGNALHLGTQAANRFKAGANIGSGTLGGRGRGRGRGAAVPEEAAAGAAAAKAAADRKKEEEERLKLLERFDQMQKAYAESRLTVEGRIQKQYLEKIVSLQEIQKLSKNEIDTTMLQGELKKQMVQEIADLEKKAHEDMMKQKKENTLAMIDSVKQYGTATMGYIADWSGALQTIMKNQGNFSKKEALKMHKLTQSAQIGDIIMRKGALIFKNLAQYGPLGMALNAPLIALAAAQIAAIKSTPPPSFHQGGIVRGPDVVNANLLRGEMVLDRATTQRIGGHSGVQNLGQPKIIIANPFKHFDRFTAASMRGDSRIRELVESPSGRRGF